MILFDTSIFVAAAQTSHTRHKASLSVLVDLPAGKGCCAAHTLVELYSVLTRSPRPQRLQPEDALQLVDQLRERMKTVVLDQDEQYGVIREMAKRGLSGGIVHDALIMRCAKKVRAHSIYTLNAKHFKMVAPEMAELVREP